MHNFLNSSTPLARRTASAPSNAEESVESTSCDSSREEPTKRAPKPKLIEQGDILYPDIPLRRIDRKAVLDIFSKHSNGYVQGAIISTELDPGIAIRLGALVEANLADPSKLKRLDFKISPGISFDSIIESFMVEQLNAGGHDLVNLRSEVIQNCRLAAQIVSWCLPPKTPISGRLVCGDKGRGEDYHDDIGKIVGTLPFSGPGTDWICSDATEPSKADSRHYVPIRYRKILESEKYSAPSGQLLLMRGSTFGNAKGNEFPLFPVPGLVHKKPHPETCGRRFAFVVHADFDWRWGVKQHLALKPPSS